MLTGRPTIRPRRTASALATDVVIDDVATNATELSNFDELLESGLFTAAVDGAVKFTHRSIAEFLAGEILAAMPPKGAAHLLVDPLHPGQVVPQLAGTAVWAASLNYDLYRWLADVEPELLLTANLASATEEQRRIVGRAVLRVLDGPVPPRDRRYTWLAYGGLADDVAPYLADDKESWVKVEAAHILSHSGCHDLDERLVELIEDIAQRNAPDYLGEDTRLATSLVYALHATQRPDLLSRLADVADQDDAPVHMRVEVLGELWGRLPATTLLPILTRLDAVAAASPVADTVATQLVTAIERHEVALDPLIDWVDSAGLSTVEHDGAPSLGCHDAWQTVVVATALKAVESEGSLDDARGAILTRALYAWHAATHTFLPDRYQHVERLTADGRRRLITLMLPGLPDRAAAYHLRRAGLVTTEDLEWLLRRWGPDAADADQSRNAKMLVELLVDPTDVEQEQLARSVAADFPALTPAIDELFDPRRAAEATASRASAREQAKKDAARASAEEFRLDALTAAIEVGDWRGIARLMKSPVGTRQYALGALPADAPAWKHLDTATKTQVVERALAHLRATPATLDASRPDDVGFAYTLVHTERLEAIGTLNPDAVLAWLDVLRQLPAQHHTVEAMLADLAPTRPEQLDRVVVRAITEDAAQTYPRQTRMLGTFTSRAVEDALYDLATHRDTPGPVVQGAIEALNVRDLIRGVRAAHHVILRRPADRPSGTLFSRAWRQAVHACAALIASPAAAEQLDRMMNGLDRSSEFAYDVVAQTGDGSRNGASWPTLNSEQFATLYLWARRTLPREPEYAPGAVISVNPVYEFPNGIFNRLASRDDLNAAIAIERIAKEIDESWPRRAAADISRRVREKNWTPLSLQAVDAILADPARRVVTSEPQLASVLLDVIDEVADEIANNPDVASMFWHQQAGKPTTWRPVDEPTFTTRFVERIRARLDTIIVRQEGQLHLGLGDIVGSFPDIEAVAVHDGVQLSVAGEAKGNWHDELLTAIETQLADRYVTGVRTSTGIYVVAYFASDRWDLKDYRRTRAGAHDRNELQTTLAETARALSVDGKTIHVRVIPIEI